MASRIKRNPDAGVATAVASVIQHQSFKRMLMFGLRSLSDFCMPSNMLHKENALDALQRGAINSIASAVQAFPDDEDLLGCASRVLWATSDMAKEELDSTITQKLINEGSLNAIATIVNSCPTDAETVENSMNFIDNITDLGVSFDGAALVPGLLGILGKEKLPAKAAKKVTKALDIVSSSSKGAAAINDNKGILNALQYCLKYGDLDQDSVQMIEHLFDTCKNLAQCGYSDNVMLNKCIELMDKYKTKKGASAKGSAALSLMVGPEQLRSCLKILKTDAPGTPQHDDALTMLSSMSYISSYADEIVKAGAIPTLISLINNGLNQIESNPEKIYAVICGACRMLSRIASNPSNVDAIAEVGGVASLCTALSYCTSSNETVGLLCLALVPLSNRQIYANEIVKYQAYATVLPLLYGNVENKDLACPAMELVATGSQHVELQDHMIQNKAVEICSTCCQYHMDNASYQLNAITALTRLSNKIVSIASLYEYGGLGGIAASLSSNATNNDVALSAVQLCEKLSRVSDATTYMCDGQMVDAILEAMLEHEDNEALISAGVATLSVIATEDDCKRHLDSLGNVINVASSDPDRVYKTLAAVCGLTRVPQLRTIFEEKQAVQAILRGIQSWIESPKFESQSKIIHAGLKTAKTMQLSCSTDLSRVIIDIEEVISHPAVRRIVELQEPDDNVLVHGMTSVCDLAAADRVGSESLEACIESTLKVMKKYTESRKTQVLSLQALNYFVQTENGVKSLINLEGVKTIINYLNKAPMYLDAQIAGFTVLAACVKVYPESVDVMRKCNCLKALQTAMRTHSKSKELKRVIAPLLALLMPIDAIEREIREILRVMQEDMDSKRHISLYQSLLALNELLVTAEGSKIGVKCEVQQKIAEVQNYLAKNQNEIMNLQQQDISGKDFHDSLISEASNAILQLCQTRVGRVNCTKANNMEALINFYGSLKPPASQVTEEAASRTLDAMRLLMKHDKNNAEIAFRNHLAPRLCHALEHYPNCDAILTSACSCLAAMASTSNGVERVVQMPEFDELLKQLNEIINTSPNPETKAKAITALQELLQTNDPNMCAKIGNSGSVYALLKVINENPDNAVLTKEAAKALALLGNFEDLRKYWNGNVREPAASISNALSINKNNPETAAALLDIMNKLTCPDDKALLRDAGALEIVAETMMIHHDNPEIIKLGGELFAKMGADEQIKAIMHQIIQVVNSGADDTIIKVDNLSAQLATFLTAPVENAAEALVYTVPCLQALAQCLASAPEEGRLHENVATVTRRLCDRCFDDSEDAFGAWAVTSSGMLHQYAGMIQNGIGDKNKKFLIGVYRTLAATAANPYSNETLQQQADVILPHTYELLDLHQNDPEVVARILEFLKYVAEDPMGTRAILNNNHIVNLTLKLMNQHNKSDLVCVAGMGLLGALGAKSQTDCFAGANVLRDCEKLCLAVPSDARQCAYLNLLERLLEAKIYNEPIVAEGCIEKAIARVRLEEEEKRMSDAGRANLYASLAKMLEAAANAGLVSQVEKGKGFDALIKALEEFPENPNVVKSVNKALKALALADENLAARTMKEAIPKLNADSATVLQTDPECADTYLDLLEALSKVPGNGRQLMDSYGLEENLAGIESLADYYDDDYGKALKNKVGMVKQALVDDQPKVKTCKDVYDLLQKRVEEDQSISIVSAAVLEDEMKFLFTQMNEYGQENLDHTNVMGEDHQYGNQAFEIFCSDAANVPALVADDIMKLELSCIKSQSDDDIIFYAVRTLNAFCKHPVGAQNCVKVSGCATIVTESVSKMQSNTSYSDETRETYLLGRVALVESVAINRNVFNKTDIMLKLVACWNDFDKGKYSTALLRQVFRSMRKVVSDAHVADLLKANVLKRLINIINDVNADMAVLPDVLFLLGSLAVVPEIKTNIGEIQGIEACVGLLTRSLAGDGYTAALTNCCLALANICIGHKKNAAIFQKLHGPELNVEVLRKRGSDYDVTNGASVLLCNLLYKNEPMKKYFGTIGAPDALVKALQTYNGSEEKNAIRCLQSLFKAISNMSLYTANVPFFLQAGIQDSYKVWLQNLGDTFPDTVLETGLRTLSNLVVENEELNMRRFGVTLLPCIRVLNQGREHVKVYLLLLDILFSLSRLNENAETFANNEGIDIVVRIVHQFHYDVTLLIAGIRVLGIQSTLPNSIQLLIKADVFSILVGCVEVDEEGNEVTELVIAALRCSRRIIQDSYLAEEYINAGGLSTVADTICKSINQSMVMLEVCRVLLCLLSYAEEVPEKIIDEEYMDVGDESGDVRKGEPSGPAATYGWKRLGMDVPMVEAILQSLCACSAVEAFAKQLRLHRVLLGLCAYFTAEHCGTDSLVSSGFEQSMVSALDSFAGDSGITRTVCVAINNIATTSGDLYEAVATEKLTSALKNAINKLPTKNKEEKDTKTFCSKTLDAMKSSGDSFELFADRLMEYDLSLTEWNKDPYPNGVQDLPTAVKDALRKGGRVKIFIGEKEREEMKWRSSQDLNVLEWNIGTETEWNNRVPIVRIKNVTKGLAHPSLEKANKKEPRKVIPKVCLCIYGPATEDTPEGIELPIKMKTQKERDSFVEMFVMWRDSATYNF